MSDQPDQPDQRVYYLPVKPADIHADYLSIQETAWVLKCSVTKLRRLFRADKAGRLHSRPGRRIVTNREGRARIYALMKGTPKKSAAPRPAQRAA
ncbi:DNA-binding protein [Streptomyces syringium]|uniref:DNA-binding protein n=1 Tax=Streptomyces syringium TaxID=76729 RepID=UPI003451B243